jgi:hypothetical protein
MPANGRWDLIRRLKVNLHHVLILTSDLWLENNVLDHLNMNSNIFHTEFGLFEYYI